MSVQFSAKFHNTWLNDNHDLLPGAEFLNIIIFVLLQFRQHPFAVIADIEKMFHQARKHMKDTEALRFLWGENP